MTTTYNYTALIRTYNSAPIVFDVIEKLKSQSWPPTSIMVVDSGTSGEELEQLKAVADQFIDISRQPFNFSRAINLGVEQCGTDYVLIISSHVVLNSPMLIHNLCQALDVNNSNVGSINHDPQPYNRWVVNITAQKNFNGENGVNNSCSFLPVKIARELPFREEVFSAEDQEWSLRYFNMTGNSIVTTRSCDLAYLNLRYNYTKKLNEEVSIAYFVDPTRQSFNRIAMWLLKAGWSFGKMDMLKARFRLQVALELVLMRFRPPSKASRYF